MAMDEATGQLGFVVTVSWGSPRFDVEQNCELDLWEVPLIVMDGTLRNYRDLTPEQGEMCILELARRCKQVEGTFTLLWHNTSLDGEWRPWREMYQRVVKTLARMQEQTQARTSRLVDI
jgi:hypothetical protein